MTIQLPKREAELLGALAGEANLSATDMARLLIRASAASKRSVAIFVKEELRG